MQYNNERPNYHVFRKSTLRKCSFQKLQTCKESTYISKKCTQRWDTTLLSHVTLVLTQPTSKKKWLRPHFVTLHLAKKTNESQAGLIGPARLLELPSRGLVHI